VPKLPKVAGSRKSSPPSGVSECRSSLCLSPDRLGAHRRDRAWYFSCLPSPFFLSPGIQLPPMWPVQGVGPTNICSLETSAVRKLFLCLLLLASGPTLVRASDQSRDKSQPAARSRTFLFTYGATVTDLKPGTKARIWLPVPSSNSEQEITIESKAVPGEIKMAKD